MLPRRRDRAIVKARASEHSAGALEVVAADAWCAPPPVAWADTRGAPFFSVCSAPNRRFGSARASDFTVVIMDSFRYVAAAPLIALLLYCAPACAWFINEDYQQRDARAATDFEMIFAGDIRSRIDGGGTSDVTNPFPGPTRSVRLTEIGNTQVTFSGTGTIAQNLTANRHFGLFGSGQKPVVRLKAWSYGTSPFAVPVPVANLGFTFDPNRGQVIASLANLSDDTISVTDFGYALFSSEQPISMLNRINMPPSAFIPVSFLNGMYDIGDRRSFTVDALSSQYIVTYATLQFAGSSADNAYGLGTAGEWAEVLIGVQRVPEPATWVLLAGALIATLAARRGSRALVVALLLVALIAPADAWKRGNHASDWRPGQTLKLAVDTPPGDAAQQKAFLEAVAEAVAEWNTAQAAFGGLKLEISTAAGPDVHISWGGSAWGGTKPGKSPVEVNVQITGKTGTLNSRGVARTLKHELGHVEGLGHSANSALMKEDAYSSNPGKAPSAADLNTADPFIGPTADDLAGKKTMWGTTEKLNEASVDSSASFNGIDWRYTYLLQALVGPTFSVPITEFTLDLPLGIDADDMHDFLLPVGWREQFLAGLFTPDPSLDPLDIDEGPSPSLLRFFAESPSFGLLPGQNALFAFSSDFVPTNSRAFTNSPSFDSDELTVLAPTVPEPSTLFLLGIAGWVLGWLRLAQAARRE
jgi:hypothetical protein